MDHNYNNANFSQYNKKSSIYFPIVSLKINLLQSSADAGGHQTQSHKVLCEINQNFSAVIEMDFCNDLLIIAFE